MAKISPVSGKYIISATIHTEGVVDRPDIIGAIFGQTEGLLGSQLELRELQRSGRIGRIEVNTRSKGGKTDGDIVIPSSLDKAETAIIGAALEIIERIGPCSSNIRVNSIKDIRIAKRTQVVERAKELLKQMQTTILPDSQEISEEVAESVRVLEIESFGPEKLPCGPGIHTDEEIIIVEGRADVLNLLKHGFQNAISMNGSNVPKTLAEFAKKKKALVFVDGDRGGLLNIKELLAVTKVEYIAQAPDGKEVEELTQKEIHQAIRAKVTPDKMKGALLSKGTLRKKIGSNKDTKERAPRNARSNDRREPREERETREPRERVSRAPRKETDSQKATFEELHSDLVGSHAAVILDKDLAVLGRVPVSELSSTVESLEQVFAVVLDGEVDSAVLKSAEKASIKHVVGSELKKGVKSSKVNVVVLE